MYHFLPLSVGQDLELVTSPTSTSVVKGEANLLRYFARRFNLFNHAQMNSETKTALVESIVDDLSAASYGGQSVQSMIEAMLKKSKFLAFDLFTIADGFAFSLMRRSKGGNLPAILSEWMKRCVKSFDAGKFLLLFASNFSLKNA